MREIIKRVGNTRCQVEPVRYASAFQQKTTIRKSGIIENTTHYRYRNTTRVHLCFSRFVKSKYYIVLYSSDNISFEITEIKIII